MKKILSALSATALSVLLFAGCGQNTQQSPRNNNQETPSGQVDSMLDSAGNAVSNTADTVMDAVTPEDQNQADQTSATNKGGQPSIQDKANTQNFIGEDKAKQLALDKAGIAEGDTVIFDRTELDNDNGVWIYEVEFKTKSAEYDAEIKAEDGSFVKWEVDKY